MDRGPDADAADSRQTGVMNRPTLSLVLVGILAFSACGGSDSTESTDPVDTTGTTEVNEPESTDVATSVAATPAGTDGAGSESDPDLARSLVDSVSDRGVDLELSEAECMVDELPDGYPRLLIDEGWPGDDFTTPDDPEALPIAIDECLGAETLATFLQQAFATVDEDGLSDEAASCLADEILDRGGFGGFASRASEEEIVEVFGECGVDLPG